MTTQRDFENFDADDILAAWLEALQAGLGGEGRSFAPEIVDLDGETAQDLRATITAQLAVQPFNAAAFRASTRVAKDLGAICAVMADATPGKVVSLDVFQLARELVRDHPSCPEPTGGTGPFC